MRLFFLQNERMKETNQLSIAGVSVPNQPPFFPFQSPQPLYLIHSETPLMRNENKMQADKGRKERKGRDDWD